MFKCTLNLTVIHVEIPADYLIVVDRERTKETQKVWNPILGYNLLNTLVEARVSMKRQYIILFENNGLL